MYIQDDYTYLKRNTYIQIYLLCIMYSTYAYTVYIHTYIYTTYINLSLQAYFYRSIFEDHYPQNAAVKTVPGGPSIACSTARYILYVCKYRTAASRKRRSLICPCARVARVLTRVVDRSSVKQYPRLPRF